MRRHAPSGQAARAGSSRERHRRPSSNAGVYRGPPWDSEHADRSTMEGYRRPSGGSSLPGPATGRLRPVVQSSDDPGLRTMPCPGRAAGGIEPHLGTDIMDKGGEVRHLMYARGGRELPHGRERGSWERPGPATGADAGGANNLGQAKGRERRPTIPRPDARCMKRSGSPPRCFAAGIVSDASLSVNGRKVSDAPIAGGVPQG